MWRQGLRRDRRGGSARVAPPAKLHCSLCHVGGSSVCVAAGPSPSKTDAISGFALPFKMSGDSPFPFEKNGDSSFPFKMSGDSPFPFEKSGDSSFPFKMSGDSPFPFKMGSRPSPSKTDAISGFAQYKPIRCRASPSKTDATSGFAQ